MSHPASELTALSPAWQPVDRLAALSIMFSFPDRFSTALMYDPNRVAEREISRAASVSVTGSPPLLVDGCVDVRMTTDGRGRGAFAAKALPAGTHAHYEGLLATSSDEVLNDHPYALDQLPPGVESPGGSFYAPLVVGCPFAWTSYVNHAPAGANLRLAYGTRSGGGGRGGSGPSWPFLVTTRAVAAGEELTLDYDSAGGEGGLPFAEAQAHRAARFEAMRALARDPRGLSLDAVFDGLHAWEAARLGGPPGQWPPTPPELRGLWQPLLDLARGERGGGDGCGGE